MRPYRNQEIEHPTYYVLCLTLVHITTDYYYYIIIISTDQNFFIYRYTHNMVLPAT